MYCRCLYEDVYRDYSDSKTALRKMGRFRSMFEIMLEG